APSRGCPRAAGIGCEHRHVVGAAWFSVYRCGSRCHAHRRALDAPDAGGLPAAEVRTWRLPRKVEPREPGRSDSATVAHGRARDGPQSLLGGDSRSGCLALPGMGRRARLATPRHRAHRQLTDRMSDEVLLRAERVSKKFCKSLKQSLVYGVRDIVADLFPFRQRSRVNGQRSASAQGEQQGSDVTLRPGEFWALEDVSFELRRSECLGLIGANGAGKTTLLKMLNGLIRPDQGRIEI